MGGIVGRELEQRQLLQLLATARTDGAASIALAGEAGIGKSALLEWLCRQADGFTVLQARGHEADRGAGYLVLRQLLKPILHHASAIDAHLADALHSALRLSDTAVNEALVPMAVLELCSLASTESPLVVALDDAHLFDVASLAALTFAARRMISEHALVVFAFRPHELAEPSSMAAVPRLLLSGLDDDASRAMLEASGRRSTPEVLRWCRGNPLALEHAHTLVDGAGAGPGPDRLRQGFRNEMAHMAPRTQRALSVVAVAGSVPPGIRSAALAAVGLAEHDLRAAVAAEVLGNDAEFRHPLLREAALPSAAEAAVIHDALSSAFLEVAGPDDDRVLLHRLQGAGPFSPEVIAAAEVAADGLQAGGRTDDAHALFLAAAERCTDPAVQSHLFRRAAMVFAFAERYAASLPVFRRALDVAPTAQARIQVVRSMVWSQLWSGSMVGSVTASLLAELRAAPSDEVDRDQLAMGWGSLIALYIASDIHAALAALAEMPVGLDVESDKLMARLTANDPGVLPDRARFEERMGEVTLLSGGAVDPAGSVYGELLLLEGRWREADRWAKRYFDDVRAAHHDTEFGPAIARWIVSRLFLGDCLTAYGLTLTALERVPDDGSALGIGALAGAVVGAESAKEWAQRCLERGRSLGITTFVVDGLHRLGLIAMSAGRDEEAAELLQQAWQQMVEHGFRHPGYSYARGDIAEAFALTGRVADARVVIDELEAGVVELRWARGVAARARGILGDAGQFERAIELLQESPWEVARTRLAWARSAPDASALRRGQSAAAVAAFDEMGARPWAALSRALLPADGDQPGAPSDPLADLSERERTVSFAVARGLTNKEVAGELYISLKTVDAHLQQIYRKLDINSRTQLAALCHSSALAA